MAKVDKTLNPQLVKAVNDFLAEVMKDPAATLLDKMRVIDRALALEKIKLKIEDDQWGSGFTDEEETDEQRG